MRVLSTTTKTYLREIFLEKKYGRRKEITTKQMVKGVENEEIGITVYSRWAKKLYYKNEVRLKNEYLTGEPDCSDNKDIMKTKKGVDIKLSWSIFTFPFPDDKLDKGYECQNQGYMNLTGADEWSTAFILVNAPGHLILDEKKRLQYKMNCSLDEPEYIEKCIEIEKNYIFNIKEFKNEEPGFDMDCKEWTIKNPIWDIPLNERVIEFNSYRDDEFINNIPQTVGKARKYMNQLASGIFI